MPGILGGIVSAIVIASAEGNGWYASSDDDGYIFSADTLAGQAGNQLLAIMITLAIAIIGGLCAGFIIKFMTFPNNPFTDQDNFVVPDKEKDYLRGTIRNKQGISREDIDFE